ncbi:rRNA maturation RNase YbeY [Sphingomonas flavescens]|uniref:rRNA maturation RNase YbeY n=1 Tax=Sphingomonas flavescens TaxID=3132797 RepID=UPI002804F091|nr:rRNA maturation RNase YbeY [Sphingomonas limnosediminicola]
MLEIDVEADEEWDSSRPWAELVRGAAEAAIAESAYLHLAETERPIELSVRLTSDEEVRALNDTWRDKDKPTNVLSFPLAEPEQFRQAMVAGPELLLGDIVLARGVCVAEAADKGISVDHHATHLLIHGTLHLLGYDHLDDETAEDMEAREVRALSRLGIADPYKVAA